MVSHPRTLLGPAVVLALLLAVTAEASVHRIAGARQAACAESITRGYGMRPMRLSTRNRIRIEVDRDLCIGSGDCVDTAPKVFELDDEGKAIVIDPDGAATDDVVEAGRNCPVTAIFVVGEEGDLYP